ncbi:hypothetical protein [Escherichia coli]|uniref:hypothetical protein n=1 Tax=Escherichia coli TaxID=562 RepID=UPI003D342FD0
MEHVLLPKYNKGKSRARNREYEVQNGIEHYNRKRGRLDISRAARKKKQTLPSKDPFDPHYRRLRYVRYADDFLLGFSGPKSEAEEIKKEITLFLQNNLSLEVSQEKTLITHGRTDKARFLDTIFRLVNVIRSVTERKDAVSMATSGYLFPPM